MVFCFFFLESIFQYVFFFFFSSSRRHTRLTCDWSSDVCSPDLERMPLGRHIYAIGANEKAAALNGIPVRAYVIGVFVGSGLIAGIAGCVLAAKLRIGQANVGLDSLLPALVGAFLGSTTIKPGRGNVLGTVVEIGRAHVC